MMTPISDPLTFWMRTTLRLGLVLTALSVLPAVIDFLFFRGGAIVAAIIALYTLAPLAVLSLLVGSTLWVFKQVRR